MFGLPRSGTHYLRWLIEHNFRCQTHKDTGWEHSLPHDRWERHRQRMTQTVLEATAGLTRLVIYKDRERWLQSVERQPQAHQQLTDYLGPHPERIYDEFLSAWAPHAAFIRYESFIQDFPSTLEYLGTLLGSPPSSYRVPATVPESPDWRPGDHRHYLVDGYGLLDD